MKKTLAILAVVLLIIIVIIVYKYNSYKSDMLRIQKLNEEYEIFTNNEIVGTSLITLINKATDSNNKNNIQLDKNNLYIENDTTSIKIEIKFLESEETYPMERISKLGSEEFIKNYATATFKCTDKHYHEKTNNVKYLLFEQI